MPSKRTRPRPAPVDTPPAEAPPPNDAAPDGQIRAHDDVEAAVFATLFNKGIGTPRQIADRIAKTGPRYTMKQVKCALDAWCSRGWVTILSDGKAHLSGAALAYLR